MKIFPFDVGASFVNILGIDSDPSGNLYMFDLKHFLKFNIAGRLLAVSETDIFKNISVKDFFLDSSGNLNVLFDDQSFQGFDYRKFDSNLNGVALEDEVFDQEAKKIAGSSVETLVPISTCPPGTTEILGNCVTGSPCLEGFTLTNILGANVCVRINPISQCTGGLGQISLLGATVCTKSKIQTTVLEVVEKIFAMGQRGEIKEYTSDLAFVNIVVPESLGGIDMDLDSNGNLFVLSQNKVHKFNDAAGPNPSSSFNLKENSAGPDSRIVLDDNGNVYVTFPVTFPGAIPRIDKYSNNGDFLAFAVPDGTPGDFDSFLQKGDFTNVQDITISQDVIFVAENEPLKRVHFFDSGPFTIIDSNSASVTYSSSILGSDQFAFKVFDLFVDSAPANVDVEVIVDVTPPDIALSPEADDFIPEITPISNLVFNIENQQSQIINEIEHFVLAHQIISQYKELYQTTLGDSFPDKMVPYLKEKAMKVAMLNTNYKEQQSSQVLDQSKIAYPVLWEDNSQNLVQTIDYYGISNIVSETSSVQVSSCDLPDITLEGDTVGGISKENPTIAALLSFIVATDEIDPNPIITNNIPNIIPVGEHTFDVTATDESNNSATCPWNITVQDTTPPEFSAPDDVVKPVEAEKTIVSPDELGSPVVSDIVDDSVLVENDAPASGFPVRDTTVTWTATDASGNSATVTQLVTIEDTTPPEITNVPEDSVIEAINGFGNVINYDLPVASDLGGLMNDIECSMPSGSELPIGLTLILCSAMDNAFLTTFEMFSVTVVSADDDGDGITNIVDPNAAISNEFNDVSLGGITSGVIVIRGDQTVHVIDGDTVQNGVIIMSESGGLGINEDLDCKDSAGEIQRGIPDDGLEDLCYDAEGNPNADVTEIFDEDPIDGIDNDGDGLIDEDFGVAVGPIPAVVSACENSALITLGEGDAVKVTCGSITIEAVSGTVEISFSGGATTTLDPGESMTFDADTLSVTAGPNTDAIIKVGDQEIPIESGQTIQLDGESTPTIQDLIDFVDSQVSDGKLDPRIARSMLWLLNAANSAEQQDDTTTAVSKIKSFNSRVGLFVDRNIIDANVGTPLIDLANDVITELQKT